MGEDKYDRELHLIDRALHVRPRARPRSCTRSSAPASRRTSCRTIYLLVPAAGAAGARRLAGVVAQHHLRLLVRHLAVPGLVARHRVLLRAADARARASSTATSTPTSPDTGSTALMEALSYGRHGVLRRGAEGAVQSVAGFASLHVAITLLVALMVQYTAAQPDPPHRLLGQLRASPSSPPSTSAGTTSPTTSRAWSSPSSPSGSAGSRAGRSSTGTGWPRTRPRRRPRCPSTSTERRTPRRLPGRAPFAITGYPVIRRAIDRCNGR